MAETTFIVENFETGAILVPMSALSDKALRELASSGNIEAAMILVKRS